MLFSFSITAQLLSPTIDYEYIATNVTPTTDRQSYLNKSLLNLSSRPAIDSSLPATRIGSYAQSKLIKPVSAGIKNELTNYRISTNNSLEYARLTCPNHISLQDHPFICSIETSLIPLLVYRNGILSNNLLQIHRLLFILSFDYPYLYHIPFIPKTPYPLYLYPSVITFSCYGVLFNYEVLLYTYRPSIGSSPVMILSLLPKVIFILALRFEHNLS